MKKIFFMIGIGCVCASVANGATVVANIDGKPITDTDITARTKLMARQGKTGTDNRHQALQNIIDDAVKLKYAANFGVSPTDKEADTELARMDLGDLSESERAMARSAMRANMAWQVIVARTVMPTVDVSSEDIKNEKIALEREHGLPIDVTLVRAVDVPNDIAKKLTRPKNCDDAMSMLERMGGVPQRFTARQYELSADVREQIAGLDKLTWSVPANGEIFLVCDTKKTAEYGKLDEIIKQNAVYKQAMTIADQQLKQLRRRAVIIINDDRYKI